MNKKAIYALAAISLVSVISQSAMASDDNPFIFEGMYSSTLKISSNITASPCTVDTASKNTTITIPATDAASLNNTLYGFSKWSNDLKITLTDCPAATTKVDATFTGTPSDNVDWYKNTSTTSGDAADVGIELMSLDDISLKNGAVLPNIPVTNGVASFSMHARLQGVKKGEIGAGMVATAVSINFTYK